MINFYKLYMSHFKSSKKVLIIASIGLICALTIVSSTNYYFDNSKPQIVENYLTNDVYKGYQADVAFSLQSNLDSYNQSLKDIATSINTTQAKFNFNYFKSIAVHSAVAGLVIPVGSNSLTNSNPKSSQPSQIPLSDKSVLITELTPSFTQDLKQLLASNSLMNDSKLPTEGDPIPQAFVVTITPSTSNVTGINSTTNQLTLFNQAKTSSINLQVTGISSLNLEQNYCSGGCSTASSNTNKYLDMKKFIVAEESTANNGGVQDLILVPNMQNLLAYLKANGLVNNSTASNSIYTPPYMSYAITIDLNYAKIDPYSTSTYISKINNFNNAFQDALGNHTEFKYIDYTFNSEYLIQSIGSGINNYIFALLLVSIPVLIATIFITNYSFGLIYKNVVQQIGIYKIRGGESRMILLFQVIDNAIIIVLSTLVALVTGIPLSMLTLQSNYLLSFQYPAPSYYILNYQAVATLLLYCAIALTVIVDLKRIRKLSQITIIDTENTMEKDEPSWKKHYYDFWMFGFGMVIFLIFYGIFISPSLAALLEPAFIILRILLLPMIFMIIISLFLMVNRLIPVILNKIGTILWGRTGDLVAFSFKNVIRHRQASTRAVMVVTVLIAFIIFFYALPYSSIVSNEQNFYYRYGAEGNANFGSNGYNTTTLSIIQENFSQYLIGFTPYVILSDGTSNSGSAILLVNTSSYLKTAYLNFDLGLTNSINQDFQNLNINSSNFSDLNVLLDSNALNNRKASIGSNIFISGNPKTLGLHIVDFFQHWPVLEFNTFSQQNNLYGIGDINYYTSYLNQSLSLNQTPLTTLQSQGVLFKFKAGVNQSLVASWITGNTSLTNFNLESVSQEQFTSGFQFRSEIGQINNNILMTFAISIIVLMMFAYLQLNERRKEIFTERAIGMKLHQIAILFFIETIILSVTSIVIGVGMGMFLMELIAIFMEGTSVSYPSYQIVFPINLIIITNVLILLFTILVSIIPAVYIIKKDISKSFGEV